MHQVTLRFFNPQGADRVAVVSVELAFMRTDDWLIRLARGPVGRKVGKGMTYGPFPGSAVGGEVEKLVAQLTAEGFAPSGLHELLAALYSKRSAVRSRAALRLARAHPARACDALLAVLPEAIDDVCSILDALGEAGDARAVEVLRQQAQRKLLSRRRSAVEALRKLGDAPGLAQARQLALGRLPDPVRSLVEPSLEAPGPDDAVETLCKAVAALEPGEQGGVLDTLYELATPLLVEVVRRRLPQLSFDRAGIWRGVKSIFKRSMLRRDHRTFGLIAHAIEVQGRRTIGLYATLKSGYDGVQRRTPVFRRATQNYLRRLCWRHLRTLARYHGAEYADACAEVLVHFGPEDAADPERLAGHLAHAYLYNRILHGKSKRLRLSRRSLAWMFRSAAAAAGPPPGVREEPYPELWDARPEAYLRVLAAARLPEVARFAHEAVIARHPELPRRVDPACLVALLSSIHEPAVAMALAELEQRFDPSRPDWDLLARMVGHPLPAAVELGSAWLGRTAGRWTRDGALAIRFLTEADARVRALAVDLVIVAVTNDPTIKQPLARAVLAALALETRSDRHEPLARVARQVLLDELAAAAPVDALHSLLDGTPSAMAIAALLLARRPGAARALGTERSLSMARHPVAAVRGAAHELLAWLEPELAADPEGLFALAECEWADSRGVALAMLGRVLDARADLPALLGLLDSSLVDVQNLGQELARRHLDRLDAPELVRRLAEHPHPNMAGFVLELLARGLAGMPRLAELEVFLRTVLLSPTPGARLKSHALQYIVEVGLADRSQAPAAVDLLAEVARSEVRRDLETALEGLVRLKLAHPDLQTPLSLPGGGVP